MGSDPAQLEELVGMEASVYAVRDKRNPEVDLYVGSTTRPMCVRFAYHVTDAYYSKRRPKRRLLKVNAYMHAEGVSNFEAHLLEKCKIEIRFEREQHHIDRLKRKGQAEFNIKRATPNPEPNPSTYIEYWKRYTRKPPTEAQRERIYAMRRVWRARNRDKVKLYQDRCRAFRNEKVLCECGARVSRANIAVHRRTQKHLSLSTVKRGSL